MKNLVCSAVFLVFGALVAIGEACDGIVFADERYPRPADPACARYELSCLKETGETMVVTGAVEAAGIRPLAEGLHAIKPLAGKGETVRFLAIDPPGAYDPVALAKALPRVAERIRAGEETVLFFAGDSVTATGDYGAMLALMLRRTTGNRRIRATKHAYSACSADASVRNFARDTAVDRPDAVFVMYGLNDAACSIPPRVFTEELSWLAREAKARFGADAVYLTPTPHFDVFINEKGVPSNPPEFARRTIGFGELVRQLGLKDGVTVVDAFDAIWSIGGGAPILETAEKARTLYPPAYFRQFEAMGEKTGDTIHLNALGHLRLARRTYETLMGRAKGPQPVTTAKDLPVDPPCWAEMVSRPAVPTWIADGKDVLHLGLPEHATGSSGRIEDNRASADEGTSDWRVFIKEGNLVFTVTTDAANRKDSFNLFFDPRTEAELGTMGPYYWLECGFRESGVVSICAGESTTSGARATGMWTEKAGKITAEIIVPPRLFDAASPRFPLGFSLVWRHTGPNGKGTRLSWSERCHEWNPMGYGRIVSPFSGLAQDARWIWYPGDYGIWWGNELQSQRLQWGARLTPFWPLYEPHSRVLFRKDNLNLPLDEELEIRCDGHAAVCYWTEQGNYVESAALGGKFTLPKGSRSIEVKIQNSSRPPSVWVKGRTLVSDGTWSVGWTSSGDKAEEVPVDSSARFVDPATPPGLAKLPTKEKLPVGTIPLASAADGFTLAADFGEETYGYLKLRDVKGSGRVKVIYAESEAEARAFDLTYTTSGALDGWELLDLSETAEFRREIAHGFRYVGVKRVSGDVTVGSMAMDYEWKDVPVRGSFRCSDPELNRIWDVSVHTLELTCREVFIEGIKRDHWVWSGDAVQSFLMNYYVFGDYDGCRDTLWTLRGKDPVKMHLNRIMDYTFYWFDAVEKYRLYSGDTNIAKQVYPRMKSLMDFVIGRLDAEGRPVNRADDWMFIDWAPKSLPNEGGVTSFEQMLLVRALEATASIATEVGATDEAAAYRARAKKLRDEIVPRYWSAEKGGLMHMIYNDGRTDPMITRYPNMFGLFYGYFDEAQQESVVRNVILNDDVLKIQTPYMRFYELESLCALGRQSDVTKEIKSYWGDMLRLGATSFWELYNPAEKGEAHYAMYGRRFGKSLCHAWGASPVYLLGRYYLGVKPTSPGFATYEVKPNLGGLDWIEGDVPTPWGKIHVRADKNGHAVTEIRDNAS